MTYECWAWLVAEADGSEGVIAAALPGMPGLSVLQARSKRLAMAMTCIAEGHAHASGRPVRLVHLVEVEVAESTAVGGTTP